MTVHPRACGERGICDFRQATARAVHPRACGERVPDILVETMASIGSSPRVRGTRLLARWGRGSLRFIPARAGNAEALRRGGQPWPVHPRACGERALRLSSPLRCSVHPRACGERLILTAG